ncbi:MAG: NADH-quinone oxidoreductase subunit N [Bacteroidetes bacterium]|nr:NADH-quinone oxidoreductase subunit N [Bacteroidota bacterium]MBS1628753.1 NADH-quinone oxidoreductase subunit N [Bacteroidota bacterium]
MYSIIATIVCGVIMMAVGAFIQEKKGAATMAALLLLLLTGVNAYEALTLPLEGKRLFNDMLMPGQVSAWFNTLMTGCTLLYVMLSGRDIRKVGNHVADYFALIFFTLCGLYILSSYNTLLMLFLGIEILSIPQYILAGADKRNLKSSEASLKYFLMGSFSTGILLMGIALLYGAMGTFHISEFSFPTTELFSPLALAGILLIVVAFGFKVSAAPMHLWTPDVYDGAPTPFASYMATVMKVAAFYAFIRLFHNSLGSVSNKWMLVIMIITAATLLIGNITAVFQQSVKRMLAYSSIAQAGFMLFAVLSVNELGRQSLIIYAVAYTLATVGMFTVLAKLKDYTYDGFNGLAKSNPMLAFATAIFIFSLAGIPLTGGFMAKYYAVSALMTQGNAMWLVLFGLLMAAVSVYYYFRVIWAMYFKPGTPQLHEPMTTTDNWLLLFTASLVILVGVAPQLVLAFA